eukprot:gene6037-8312_t
MEPRLLSWLENAYAITMMDDDFGGEDIASSENKNYYSVPPNEMMLIAGRNIFGLSGTCTMANILEDITFHYRKKISMDSPNLILEIYLIHAVSEMCQNRAEFLQGIMDMRSDVQEYLMHIIIKYNTEHNSDHNRNSLNRNSNRNSINLDKVSKSLSRSFSRQSIGDSCRACTIKEFQIRTLKQELNESQENAANVQIANQSNAVTDEMINQLKSEIFSLKNKIAEIEKDNLDKDWTIRKQKEILQDGEKKLLDRHKTINTLNEQVLTLQEEIDLMKPSAAKLDATENQLDKMRARVEELNLIKQQLREESSSHTATQLKLSSLEKELDSLRKISAQVHDYRTQFAELSIDLEHASTKVQTQEMEIIALKEQIQSIAKTSEERLTQIKKSEDEKLEITEKLREMERGYGISESMSEFNPKLMQEMASLKNENAELLEKLLNFPLDSIERLQKELDEQKYINNALQAKYSTAADSLDRAQAEITTLKTKLDSQPLTISAPSTPKESTDRPLSKRLIKTISKLEMDPNSFNSPTASQQRPKSISRTPSFFNIGVKKGGNISPKQESIMEEAVTAVAPTEGMMRKVEHDSIVASMNSTLNEYKLIIEDNRRRMGEMMIENESYQRQLNNKKHEYDMKSRAFAIADEKDRKLIAEHKSELQSKADMIASLQKELEQTRYTQEQVSESSEHILRNIKVSYKIEMDRLNLEISMKDEQLEHLETKVSELTARNNLLFEDNRSNLLEIKTLKKKIAELTNEINALEESKRMAPLPSPAIRQALNLPHNERPLSPAPNFQNTNATPRIPQNGIFSFPSTDSQASNNNYNNYNNQYNMKKEISMPTSPLSMASDNRFGQRKDFSHPPTPVSNSPQSPHSHKVNSVVVVEERLIGPKKNPDQEALEMAMLLSRQDTEFGTNMMESIGPNDEPAIAEYVSQGCTREEAILFIFETRYGKVSTQTSEITPALPRLHRAASTSASVFPTQMLVGAHQPLSKHLSMELMQNNKHINELHQQSTSSSWDEEYEIMINKYINQGFNHETAYQIWMKKKAAKAFKRVQNSPHSPEDQSQGGIAYRASQGQPFQQQGGGAYINNYNPNLNNSRDSVTSHRSEYNPYTHNPNNNNNNQGTANKVNRLIRVDSNGSMNSIQSHNTINTVGSRYLPQQDAGSVTKRVIVRMDANSSTTAKPNNPMSMQYPSSNMGNTAKPSTYSYIPTSPPHIPTPSNGGGIVKKTLNRIDSRESMNGNNNNYVNNSGNGMIYSSQPSHPQQQSNGNTTGTTKLLKRVDSFGSAASSSQSIQSGSSNYNKYNDNNNNDNYELQRIINDPYSNEDYKLSIIMSKGYNRDQAYQMLGRR